MCNKVSVGANMKPLAEWDCATSDATRQIEISGPIIVQQGQNMLVICTLFWYYLFITVQLSDSCKSPEESHSENY